MALNLRAFLGLDGSGFERGLLRARSQANAFGSSLAANMRSYFVAAFGAAAIGAAFKKAVEYSSQINTLSRRLDVGRDKLQAFNYAAKKNEATLEDVTAFLTRLNAAREEALSPTGGAKELSAFEDLGVTLEDLKNLRAEDIFVKIGEAIRNSPGKIQELSAALQSVGGRGAPKLIPAFRDGLKALEDEARRLRVLIDDDVIKKFAELGDQALSVGKMLTASFANIVGNSGLLEFLDGILARMKLLKTLASEVWVGGFKNLEGRVNTALRPANVKPPPTAYNIIDRPGTDPLRALWLTGQTGQMLGPSPSEQHLPQITRNRYQPQLNAMQQIGAYVGAEPMTVEVRKQTEVLKGIKQDTREIEQNTREFQ